MTDPTPQNDAQGQHGTNDGQANDANGQQSGQQTPPAPHQANEAVNEQLKAVQSALENARRLTARQDAEITKLKQSQLSEAEQAIENARTEGKASALKEVGARLAGAEFRARAAGKIADPAVLLDTLDLAKFVGEDGEPDTKLIDDVIDKIAKVVGNGKIVAPTVPAGARADSPSDDWLRAAMAGK